MDFIDFGAMQAQQPPPGGRPPGPAPQGMMPAQVPGQFSVTQPGFSPPAQPAAPKSSLLWWALGLGGVAAALWYIDKEEKAAEIKANTVADPEEEEDSEDEDDSEGDDEDTEEAALA